LKPEEKGVSFRFMSSEVRGFIEEHGKRRAFYLRISDPVRTKKGADYYCRVHVPVLFRSDKNIFGIDREQARKLAVEFVRQALGEKRLVDKKGSPIRLK
jgi:hypothetical protein